VRESPEQMRQLLCYLAERPGTWVSLDELGKALHLDHKPARSRWGILTGFGLRAKGRYQQSTWFFDVESRRDGFWYRMPPDAAAIVLDASAILGS